MEALTENVFGSPAVGILCDLERDGFTITLGDDGGLRIAPRSRLTPDRMATIRDHADALRILVLACDADVQARRLAFERLLAAPPRRGLLVPALVYRPVPYAPGVCFSCGATLPLRTDGRARFGRCWRCALAMRLALRVPVQVETWHAHLDAKVLA